MALPQTSSKVLEAKPITGTNFKLIIDDAVYRRIMFWVNESNHEVSGFGNVEWDKSKQLFRVTDAFLLDQDNKPTSSEICPVSHGKAMHEAYKRGHGEGSCKFHWHSHVDMATFWSSDDMNIIRGLGHRGWIVASVFNKKEDVRTAFCQLTEVMGNQHEIFIDEITTEIQGVGNTAEEEAEWRASYKQHVTESKYVAEKPSYMSKYDDKDKQLGFNQWDYNRHDWRIDRADVPALASAVDMSAEIVELKRQSEGLTNEWDNEGWRLNPITYDYQYNPVRDEALNDEDTWIQVSNMERDEFEELLFSDKAFRQYIHDCVTVDKGVKR